MADKTGCTGQLPGVNVCMNVNRALVTNRILALSDYSLKKQTVFLTVKNAVRVLRKHQAEVPFVSSSLTYVIIH